jgi:hypothetical protein
MMHETQIGIENCQIVTIVLYTVACIHLEMQLLISSFELLFPQRPSNYHFTL